MMKNKKYKKYKKSKGWHILFLVCLFVCFFAGRHSRIPQILEQCAKNTNKY